MEKDDKRKLIIILLISTFVMLITGYSYSYFSNSILNGNTATPATISTPELDVNMITTDCFNVSNANLISDFDKETKASACKFNINLPSSAGVSGAKYSLDLKNLVISDNLISNYFKWELVQYSNSSYLENSADIVTSGTFANASSNSLYHLLQIPKNIGSGGTHYLSLRLWLSSDDNSNQNSLMNGTFSSRISVNLSV